jgi:hypothetical protein
LYKGNKTNDRNNVSGMPKVVTKTQKQTDLENQIKSIKETGGSENRNRLEELNLSLSKLNGNVVERASYYGATASFDNHNPPFIQPDNIGNTKIFGSTNNIHALATFTEQIGANAGRIWVVYVISPTGATPDSVRVVYSDNGGLSYINHTNIRLGSTDKVNIDDLDIEIIENTSGDKYLWAVYGLRSTGGTGNWFVGGFNLDITNPAISFWVLNWPGATTAKRYYGIRLTSDNATYPSLSFIHIICSFDSTATNGYHIDGQKYVRCVNPYVSTAPTFYYMPTIYYWNNELDANVRTLYSDIAFFKNGSDSVIVSFSGVPDSTWIFFSKSDGNGNAPVAGQSQSGTDITAFKHHARLSTNGNNNGYVVCIFGVKIGGYTNIRYFRTSNFGNFNTYTQSILWGGAARDNYLPDIVGKRNSTTHYFAFGVPGVQDSLHYVKLNPAGTYTEYVRMNSQNFITVSYGPKPGFRFVNGDSCYVVYSEYGPINVWSAAGCSGPVIGIGNNVQTVSEYSLSQNYPNPFNPTTAIHYGISKNGLVKLTVYDILGKEVATLVNEVKTAGNYIVDFNASSLPSGVYFYKLVSGDYTGLKKMILIK